MIKIRLMLWIMPFPSIKKSFTNSKNVGSGDASFRDLIWAVQVSSHFVPRATCLTNALTGYSLLSQYGYPSLVKIGVGRSREGEFEAHAWLEYEDEVVIGESEEKYVPLYDFQG